MATKSKKTEDAVEKAKAVTAEAAEKVKAVAEDAAKKGEAAVKATKRTVKKVAETAAEKTSAVKKAAAAKKAVKKAEITTKVVIELAENSASADTLIERAKEDWSAKGNSLEDIKELSLYVNATEGMVYYVVNDDYLSGSFAF